MNISSLLAVCCLAAFSIFPLYAETTVEKAPTTVICEPTTLIVATPFNQTAPATRKGDINGWKAAIGEWSVNDSVLTGNELAEDHHHPSCTYAIKSTDMIITGEFRLGAAEFIAFGCRDSVPPNNHLARTSINKSGIWIQHMAGIAKTTKSTKVSEVKTPIDVNAWHKIRIEINGDHYRAQVNDQVVEGHHARFADEKGLVALIVKGQGGQFRNVTLWQGKPKK